EAPDAAPAASGGGWIRDLLRSASREEERVQQENGAASDKGRTPLHVVESLNSLSVDIARAIDHEASIELWERYRRGERHVFTRRLYTLKGQQTFDEIQRKYRADAEFRKAVDQYCRDFEKLLADVARNDRENMMSQTYLTSETGKVYTMLAHASGRLR
ncbi:kinesin, partial [Nitratireductor sp. GCM10026969]